MEDRGRHRIGISQTQPHINADVAPQKYNGTEGLLQENARRMVALPVLNYHTCFAIEEMQIGVFLFCEFHNFLKDSQI
jgi:hypothetical protein